MTHQFILYNLLTNSANNVVEKAGMLGMMLISIQFLLAHSPLPMIRAITKVPFAIFLIVCDLGIIAALVFGWKYLRS